MALSLLSLFFLDVCDALTFPATGLNSTCFSTFSQRDSDDSTISDFPATDLKSDVPLSAARWRSDD